MNHAERDRVEALGLARAVICCLPLGVLCWAGIIAAIVAR